MAEYNRPQIPYTPPEVLPFNNRYDLVSENRQPISSDQLDGDFNYLIASLNALFIVVQGIAAGILPGASDPTNVDKFPITDGAGTISWSKITAAYFANQSIPTAALQNGCVTADIIGNGSITNGKIQAGAIQNNNIDDDKLSFDKIANVNNAHFQEFFNTQDDATLNGAKIQAGSLPANTIADGSLPGTKITDNTLPAVKIVNNSLTRAQLAPVIQPIIGQIIPWSAPAGVAVPAGCIEGNGQLLNRTTYALLFAIYGTFYGVGDGVTTFGTPDYRGRVIAGIDPASGQPTGGRIVNGAIAVGATGGEETHTLTTPEIPSHTHTVNSVHSGNPIQAGAGSTEVIIDAGQNTGATGGGGAHNNMQPYMLNRVLIYAGV